MFYNCFIYSSYSRAIRTNSFFSVKISYFHKYMFSMAFSSKDRFTYSSYSRLIRTNSLFSVKISYFHEYTLSMAFSSKDISSDSSHIQVIPKHISKVGNRNLNNINSLLPNNKKGNINDNIGVSARLKRFTYPSEHSSNFNVSHIYKRIYC